MMTEPRKSPPSLSLSEYLEFEAIAFESHEYLGGNVFTLPGSTVRHNRIATNIYVKLAAAADQSSGCMLLMFRIKLQAAPNVIYYPDLMLICDRSDLDPLVKTRPTLVIEVLSDTT